MKKRQLKTFGIRVMEAELTSQILGGRLVGPITDPDPDPDPDEGNKTKDEEQPVSAS